MNNWIPWVIAAVVVLYLIYLYNGLVILRNRVRNAWSQIDVQLKRRHDLIPNIVASIKGYMVHERGLFDTSSAPVKRRLLPAPTFPPAPPPKPYSTARSTAFRARRVHTRAEGQHQHASPSGGAELDREPDRLRPPATTMPSSPTTPRSRRCQASSSPAPRLPT